MSYWFALVPISCGLSVCSAGFGQVLVVLSTCCLDSKGIDYILSSPDET